MGPGERYHVAIDLDDVVLDFYGGLRAVLKKEYGVELRPDQMAAWDLHGVIDPIVGRSWWQWLRERDWLWSHLPAVDGAIGGIERLRAAGLYVELVTSKPEWAEYAVWRWLGKWRPRFHRVTIVPTSERKVDHTDAELLVDDRPENCLEFVDDGRVAILFDRPHNQDFALVPGMGRARTWEQVVELVRMESAVGVFDGSFEKKTEVAQRYRGSRGEEILR